MFVGIADRKDGTRGWNDGGRDGEEEIKKKRQGFFDSLLAATGAATREKRPELPNTTFATSGSIDHYLLGSFSVDGAGVFRLPLDAIDAAKLRGVSEQAPHGQGHETILDTAVRSAWQVDASKVHFPNDSHFLTTIQKIADTAVRKLEGHNEVQVEARLYKLLFYEVGGHFKMHRDTEKEPGMFGTLIVQLPTEGGYKGGKLVVHQEMCTSSYNAGRVEIDHSQNSSTAFYYSAFFADCRHTLERVRAGTRLCLSFNLVRRNSNTANLRPISSSPMFRKLQDVLHPWLEAVEGDEAENEGSKYFPTKLAFPLQHRYTPSNLAFARLKGEDARLSHVLQNILGRRLDVHLCLLTRHETGTPFSHNGYQKKYRVVWNNFSRERGSLFRMDDVDEETVETSNWLDVDDKRLPIFPWFLDTKKEVILGKDEEGPFFEGAGPDELQYEGFLGNEGPTLEYFYHRAMMIVWPKTKTLPIILSERRPNNLYFACYVPEDAEVLSLLNMLERLHGDNDPHAHLVLSQLLAHCKLKCKEVWRKRDLYAATLDALEDVSSPEVLAKLEEAIREDKAKCVSSRLLDMCVVVGNLEDVLQVLKLFSETFEIQKKDSDSGLPSHEAPWFIGIRSKFVCKSIAAAVHAHSWTACGDAVLALLQKDRVLEEREYYVQIAIELQELGLHHEAFLIANEAFELVSSSMLASQCPSELFKIFVKVMMSMSEECLKELGPKFFQWLGPEPEFTWNQPLAHLPDYPTVEAFLRGPEESFTYHGVGSLPEARKLTIKFDGLYRNGLCASGREGGRGAGAYCEIKKSRGGFQHILQNWKQQQEQISGLRHRLQESRDRPRASEKRGRADGAKTNDLQTEGAGQIEKKPRSPGVSK